MGRRGYNEDQVDAFLDFLEAALRDPAQYPAIAERIRDVAFSRPPLGKRGYNEDEVDAFLGRVAQQVGGSPPVAAAGPPEPRGEQPPTRYSLKIRPNLFLFWTPRWHDWRTDGAGWGSSGDSGSDNILVDLVVDLLFPILLNVLWNWCLWIVWAAVAWLAEACVAVVLAPISLPASLFGLRRHRLLVVSQDGGEELVLSEGSWYSVRRARGETWDQIAAHDGVLSL
ncbi:DivIVA domain-containing protein [Mycobacterium sp. E3247]|uniref:DivIVA domain-containing protein n=1 Tax=Mycobacterium sp. E3247 TaxID=1856864 RepID=UPI0035164D5E